MRVMSTEPCPRCKGSGRVLFVLRCPSCLGARVASVTLDMMADPDVSLDALPHGKYFIKPYDPDTGTTMEPGTPEATALSHVALDLATGADADRIAALTLQRANGMVATRSIEWITAYVAAVERDVVRRGLRKGLAMDDCTPRGVAINHVGSDFLMGLSQDQIRAESRKRAKDMASGMPPDWLAEYLRECDQAAARLHAGLRA